MNPDKDIEVTRDGRYSTYAWYPTNVNDLQDYVNALYSVGAIGDETVSYKDYELRVKIASDDLMPKPARSPVLVRYGELERVTRIIVMLKIAVVLLGISTVVFLVLWIVPLVT